MVLGTLRRAFWAFQFGHFSWEPDCMDALLDNALDPMPRYQEHSQMTAMIILALESMRSQTKSPEAEETATVYGFYCCDCLA